MSLPALAWRSETAPRRTVLWHDTAPDRPPALPLDGDTTADVVVIGGGAGGLWAAWALLDADPALDLLLVEAGSIADGASGRGLGACSAWTGGTVHRGGPHGLDTALLRDAVVEVGGTAAAEQIACDFRYRGAVRVARDPRALTRLRATADPAAEDQELDRSALARRLLVAGALGGLSTPDCATTQPTLLLHGLAEALVARGGRIAEHTRALRISPGAVVTDQGIVRAERIVQATGASTVPGGSWSPRPVAETALATSPVDPGVWERVGLRRGQLLHVVGRSDLRAVRTADDRLVLVGATAGPGLLGRIRPGDPALRALADELATLLPDLATAPISHTWSWTRAATASHPVGVAADGLAWIGGHGPEPVAAANLSGRVLADLLTGSDSALTRAGAHGWD